MTIVTVFPEPSPPLTPAEVEAIENHPSAKGAERAVVSLAPDGQLEVGFVYSARKFERIRRITGYLVGTLDRFNDAKRAEERDRVKHQFETQRHGDTEPQSPRASESPCLCVGNKPDQEAE